MELLHVLFNLEKTHYLNIITGFYFLVQKFINDVLLKKVSQEVLMVNHSFVVSLTLW